MIVLDTHAWLWWLDAPERLSADARQAIDEAQSVGIPSICAMELATLANRGRIQLGNSAKEWIERALAHRRVEEIPLSSRTAVVAGLLDRAAFPGDPADRIVYATARTAGTPLVSADRAIRAFDPTRVIW